MEIYKNSWNSAWNGGVFFSEDGIIDPLNKYGFVNQNNENLTTSDIALHLLEYTTYVTNNIYYKDINKACKNFHFKGNSGTLYWDQGNNFGCSSSVTATSSRIYVIFIPTLDGVLFYFSSNLVGPSYSTWQYFSLNQWFNSTGISGSGSSFGSTLYFNTIENNIGEISYYIEGIRDDVPSSFPVRKLQFNFNKNDSITFEYGNSGGQTRTDDVITSYPYFENFKSTHNDWDYTNYNSNTCVLAKVIYNNQYVNNLYYIITSPFDLPRTGFTDTNNTKYNYNIFSFNGHTYFNFFGNLAVELPD